MGRVIESSATTGPANPSKFSLILVGGLTLIFLYSVKAIQLSGMAVGFAGATAAGDFNIHPHHLLYQPTLVVMHSLLGATGCDATCTGQLYGIFWALITVLSVFVIARRALHSEPGAILATMFVAISHGFIVFSTQLEPYGPMLGIITFLLAILVVNDGPPSGIVWNLLFIALFSLGLLYHQAMVLLLIPVGYYVIAASGRTGLRWWLMIAAVAGTFVLLVYTAVFWSTHPTEGVADFYRWLRYYGVISDSSHGTIDLSLERIKATIRALTQLFAVLPPRPEDWAASRIQFDGNQTPLRYIFVIVYPAIMLWNVVQIAKNARHARLRIFLLVWWATFGLFFFWWQAYVYKFFIPTIPPTVILGGMMVSDWLETLRTRIWKLVIVGATVAFGAAMAASNLQATVLPLHQTKGPLLDRARKLDEATPTGCAMYSMRYLGGYLNLYFQRDSLPFNLMFRKHYYSDVDPTIAATLRVPANFENEPCGVIPLYWVSREYFEQRTQDAIGEYLKPEDWSRFIAWFFEVMSADDLSGVTYSKFDVVEDTDGDRYLLFDRQTRVAELSLHSLMAKIDDLYAESPGGTFSGDDNPEAGRLRHLAFGYN